MLTLYNSLTRCKETFVPLVAGKIGIYVCGMTVYDLCHLGHGRSMVCFDVIVRFLRQEGYEVTFVRNITDIDDKIIKRAAEKGVSIQELTTQYIAAMHADAKALGTLAPDKEPCATSHIGEIIALIQRLLDKGYAYLTPQGDVCYEVSKFNHYAKLSNQDVAALMLGARVEINEDKRSALDFVLWKKTKMGEPSWPSPWGHGRPGWHIECSAMAMQQLGEAFDIHGGGLDLQFPHHDNEIAQSEAATGHPYARYWLHVGMLQVDDEKMAKSTGNFYTIRDVLERYHPEVVRYFLLSNHYRSSLNYAPDAMLNASKALMRLYQTLRGIDYRGELECDPYWLDLFRAAMLDDFNTPVALAVLFQLSHVVNKNPAPQLAATLYHLGGRLGLLQESPDIFLQKVVTGKDDDLTTINQLIEARNAARLSKNWVLADEMRQKLLKNGIELEDTAEGTIWRRRLD